MLTIFTHGGGRWDWSSHVHGRENAGMGMLPVMAVLVTAANADGVPGTLLRPHIPGRPADPGARCGVP